MAVLGAGPIGLECLLRALQSGWEADAYEFGRVGESVRRWSHVRMFSPWRMNVSAAGRAAAGLENIDPDLARIVELRAFGGLTIDEAAHVLDVSPSTAKREWRTAKAWLNRELGPAGRARD